MHRKSRGRKHGDQWIMEHQPRTSRGNYARTGGATFFALNTIIFAVSGCGYLVPAKIDRPCRFATQDFYWQRQKRDLPFLKHRAIGISRKFSGPWGPYGWRLLTPRGLFYAAGPVNPLRLRSCDTGKDLRASKNRFKPATSLFTKSRS